MEKYTRGVRNVMRIDALLKKTSGTVLMLDKSIERYYKRVLSCRQNVVHHIPMTLISTSAANEV